MDKVSSNIVYLGQSMTFGTYHVTLYSQKVPLRVYANYIRVLS